MDVRKVVVPLLFLAVIGVMLPIAIPGTNWLGVAGWAVALVALNAALWVLLRHNRSENRRNWA